MRLLGLDLHFSIAPSWTSAVEIAGVRWGAPRALAQALEADRARIAAEVARANATAAETIEAARAREAAALARAEAAEAQVADLERELAAARAALATATEEAIRADAEHRAGFAVLAATAPAGRA